MKVIKNVFPILFSFVFACGSDEGGDMNDTLEGVYQIEEYTQNSDACEKSGESALGDETFLVVSEDTVLGTPLVAIMSCTNIADCKTRYDKFKNQETVSSDVFYQVLPPPQVSIGGSTGRLEGGQCVGGTAQETILTLSDGSLELVEEITLSDPYDAEDGTICWTNLAIDAASDNVCSAMNTLRATFLETI